MKLIETDVAQFQLLLDRNYFSFIINFFNYKFYVELLFDVLSSFQNIGDSIPRSR